MQIMTPDPFLAIGHDFDGRRFGGLGILERDAVVVDIQNAGFVDHHAGADELAVDNRGELVALAVDHFKPVILDF